jgi:streptogramin lyase
MKSLLRLFVALALCYTLVVVCTAEPVYERTVIYQFDSGSMPLGVAIDPNGDYIVAESVGGTNSWDDALSRIQGSTRIPLYTSPGAMDIYDVDIDSQGNFFIAETFGASKVTKLSPNGANIFWQYSEGYFVPISVVTDTDDGCVIYWTDPWVQQYLIKLSADGTPGFRYDVPKEYRGTGGLAIDNDGDYLLATGGDSYSGGAGALLKFDRDSGSYTVIHEFEAGSCPTAVQVDSEGNYFVIGHWDNRLVKITPTGDLTTIYQFEPGTYPARFAMDSEGNFIVPEAGKDILSKISLLNVPPDILEAYADPSCLWPANNKYADIAIQGVTDPDDEFTIAITAITSDEPTTAGGKNKAPDADPACIGTDTARIRAERNGNGNGRVYEIAFVATDSMGSQSEGMVKVCVPHDQGKGSVCIDDGQLYDATGIN